MTLDDEELQTLVRYFEVLAEIDRETNAMQQSATLPVPRDHSGQQDVQREPFASSAHTDCC